MCFVYHVHVAKDTFSQVLDWNLHAGENDTAGVGRSWSGSICIETTVDFALTGRNGPNFALWLRQRCKTHKPGTTLPLSKMQPANLWILLVGQDLSGHFFSGKAISQLIVALQWFITALTVVLSATFIFSIPVVLIHLTLGLVWWMLHINQFKNVCNHWPGDAF